MATVTQTQTQEAIIPAKAYPLKSHNLKVEEVSASELPDIPLPPPTKIPTEVLPVDRDTPDSHVPRDPRLIRLTGVHPFNVEPPLTDLYNEGKPSVIMYTSTDVEMLMGLKVS